MQLSKDELRRIGNRLAECRREKMLSQEEVAEALNTSRNTISAIENNGQEFTLSKLIGFAQIYEVGVEYILYGENKGQEEDKLTKVIEKMDVKKRKRWAAAMAAYEMYG